MDCQHTCLLERLTRAEGLMIILIVTEQSPLNNLFTRGCCLQACKVWLGLLWICYSLRTVLDLEQDLECVLHEHLRRQCCR